VRDLLIYDIGAHTGEDTDFYLAQGFRVIAVEANPDLCVELGERFADAIADGRLKVVNKAVARERGFITFYRMERQSYWGTCDAGFAEDYRRRGENSSAIEVPAATMADLLGEYGSPYFIKVDIEGMDFVPIEGLKACSDRPQYISMEAERGSFLKLQLEIQTLTDLGYDRFKCVSQRGVQGQLMAPGRPFPLHSSGRFGEDAPGNWMTADEVLAVYRNIFWRETLVGPQAIAPRWARSIAWRLGLRPDWHDTHAKLAGT
jgi:FkbM family methyltransferase